MVVDCMRELWLDRWFDQRVYARRLQRNERKACRATRPGKIGLHNRDANSYLRSFFPKHTICIDKKPSETGIIRLTRHGNE